MNMRITIETIDTASEQKLGHMQVPSFLVHFRSSVVNGQARFVPAERKYQRSANRVFDVEINQESVTGFRLVEREELREGVVSLPEPGAFRVRGVVSSVLPISETEGNVLVSVDAGGALFHLERADLCNSIPSEGDAVAFDVHEVSLWDEAA